MLVRRALTLLIPALLLLGITPPASAASGAGTIAGLTLPAPGFFSGYSGGDPGLFRGQPTTMQTTWHDAADGGSWGWGPYAATVKYPGYLDIAPGGPTNWSATAGGSQDAAVRTYLTALRKERTFSGKTWPTSLRFAHELNGTWYPWSVSASEVAAFQSTMRRWEAIADTAFPEAIFAIAFNGDTVGGVTPRQYLNGMQGVFDLIGVDYYNQWPYIGTARNGAYTSWATGSDLGTVDNPRGIKKWDAFAAWYGTPYYLPEWANNGDAQGGAQSGDDPLFTRQVYAYLNADAGKGPGKAFAEAWFNVDTEHRGWHVCCASAASEQSRVAAAYAGLFPMA